MSKSYISIKCKLADSKKYKALAMPFWLLTLPLLIPLQIFVYIGNLSEVAGFLVLKYRTLIINNIAFWLKWDGANKYKEDVE